MENMVKSKTGDDPVFVGSRKVNFNETRHKQPCHYCGQNLDRIFVDLGMSPLANSYLTSARLCGMERFYPLRVYVCESCLLVQAEEVESPESIFSDYAYFSSYSDSWVQHAKAYVNMAIERFRLSRNSLVVEIASNDGYL